MVADQKNLAMLKKRKTQKTKTKPRTREAALEALEELREQHGYDAEKLAGENEATTRLLLIDRILQLLGWELENFNPEHSLSNDPGFIDYLVSADISRQHLHRLLSGNGNPTLETLASVLYAVGLTIDFRPVSEVTD